MSIASPAFATHQTDALAPGNRASPCDGVTAEPTLDAVTDSQRCGGFPARGRFRAPKRMIALSGSRKQPRMKKRRSEAPPATLQAVENWFADAFQHHRAGHLNDAERLYRRVLAVRPCHADSLHLLGVVAYQAGRHDLAVAVICQAISVNPCIELYHCNLGNALWRQGRLDEAIACYRSALLLNPDYPEALNNLGGAIKARGRLEEAVVCYRRAIDLKPDYSDAHSNLGNALREQGRLAESVACFERAVDLKPDDPEIHNKLGVAFLEQGRPDEAVASCRRAIELKADIPDVHYSLGNALLEQGGLDEAVLSYRRVLDLDPAYPEALNNLGVAVKQQGWLDEAVDCYRRAIDLRPAIPDVHYNLATALLARGDMALGWQEYEWRWKTPQMIKAHRSFAQPRWRGEAAAQQTLLIHAEQGLGDTLQFCRYAPLAAARWLRVIMQVPQPLVRLLRGLQGVDLVVADGDELPQFDFHCPMLSMPLAMRTTIATIPSAVSYLHAGSAQVMAWRTRLAGMANQGPRIGLAWAGNPRDDSPASAAVDRRRSLASHRLAPLFDVAGLHFFSLQKDPPAAPADLPLTDFMAEMNDFADTAALVTNLDLVICVDTAVAHLAAALGKPVWLLNRFDSCWRWLTGRCDSPWYPALRLYRQPQPGDWDSVLTELARDLRSLAGMGRLHDAVGPGQGG
jgi:tetratricopeptide (TPR) repeat protein